MIVDKVSKFRNIHMPNHDFMIHWIDKKKNKLSVEIRPWDVTRLPWTENDWNLQHTESGFERGEYYSIQNHQTIPKTEAEWKLAQYEARYEL